MPKCKRCNSTISRLDSDICPFCGEKNPIDVSYETMDMTSLINNNSLKDTKLAKRKSKRRWILFGFLLGFLGIDLFYIGRKKAGLIICLSSLIIYTGLSLLLFFIAFNNFIAFLIPLGYIVLVNLVCGLFNLLKNSPKDSDGEFLR